MSAGETCKALRVTQLDADQIDAALARILKSNVVESLQHVNVLRKFEPEINVLMMYVVWKYSVNHNSTTVGQDLLGVQYYIPQACKHFKIVHLLAVLSVDWFSTRKWYLKKLARIFLSVGSLQLTLYCLNKAALVLECFQFVNYILFILNGRYVTLLDRCLLLEHVFMKKPTPRYIDYVRMRKELLWEGITQTAISLLPYVNFQRIYNYFLRKSEFKHIANNCCVCNEVATSPQTGDCGHTYCWYCIQANLLADFGYICPACGVKVSKTTDFIARTT